MTGKTLNAYLPLLKKKQQEYIVHCVRTFGDMPDFHRGLLPFLSAQTAAASLKVQLERLKGGMVPLPNEKPAPVLGERFICDIISVFQDALMHKLYEDEVSITMHLKDGKLGSEFGPRYKVEGFRVSITGWAANNMANLERVSRNRWKVTTSPKLMDETTTYLSEYFS